MRTTIYPVLFSLFFSIHALAETETCEPSKISSNFLSKFDGIRRHECAFQSSLYSSIKTIEKKHEAQQLSLYEGEKKSTEKERNCLNGETVDRDGACRKRFKKSPLDPFLVGAYGKYIDTYAAAFNIDPLLLHAIAFVESRYNPSAVSPKGARGLMQLMPATAERFGFKGSPNELFDPVVNIQLSCAYLRSLYEMFGNDIPLVLAAYNAGENAVIKYGRQIPPYLETQDYVTNVVKRYLELRTY